MNLDETVAAPRETSATFTGGQLILGRYKLERVLGQGGMGIVWLARDEELERDVALKFLPNIVVNDRASLADLKKETRRSLELTHPFIVRTYDFVQDKESTVAGISMEYVDADTLRNRRIDQPNKCFEPAELAPWVRQLCEALDYAHHHAEIVHRDLKPANLMINRRNQLKVADFGIARSLVESVTQMTGRGVSGTLVYMSPQQLSGDAPHPGDDIYAVGATIYELITTRPPFYSGDIAGQVYGKTAPSMGERRAQLGIPAGEIPQIWEETVAACLAKDPALRPQTAGEIAVRLGLMEASALITPKFKTFDAGPSTAATIRVSPGPSTWQSGQPTVQAQGPATIPPLPKQKYTEPKPPSLKILGGMAAAAALLLGGAGWYYGKVVPAQETAAQQEKQQAEASQLAAAEKAAAEKAAADKERAANARGSLVIQSEPAGAIVSVDGKPMEKTPAVLTGLEVGLRRIEIAAPGYDTVSFEAEVKGNQATEPGKKVLPRTVGSVRVVTAPAGLPFELRSLASPNSEPIRHTSPWTSDQLPVGEYELVVTREGWPAQRKVFTLERGAVEQALIEFASGSVVINSEPPGARVVHAGKELGVTPLTLADLPAGQTAFTVVKEGYESQSVSGTVESGKSLALSSTLRRRAAANNFTGDKPAETKPAATAAKPTPRKSTASRQRSRSSSSEEEDDRGSRTSTWEKARTGAEIFQRVRGFGF